jgi:hypothetical protein
MTIRIANLIERALQDKDGQCRYWLSETTPDLIELLVAHGLEQAGTAPSHRNVNQQFWGVWRVKDREKAESAVKPYRAAPAPIDFTLTPFDQGGYMAEYACPKCRSNDLYFHDGDSVGVPVLPEGIGSYDQLDTGSMVGTCKSCDEPIYFYEFGFTTVPNPNDDEVFSVGNLPQSPDRFQLFYAHAEGHDPWIVSRLFFDTGKLAASNSDVTRLPKGPFVVDYHQFGPYSLDYAGELSGPHGVARCSSGANNKWTVGELLFRNLAGNAMKCLLAAAEVDTKRTPHQ